MRFSFIVTPFDYTAFFDTGREDEQRSAESLAAARMSQPFVE